MLFPPLGVALVLLGVSVVLIYYSGNDFGPSIGNTLYDFAMGFA